jgi:hypothetical protein
LKKSLVWGGRKKCKRSKKTIIGYIQKKTRGKKQTFLGFSQLPILSAWQLDSPKRIINVEFKIVSKILSSLLMFH